mmetsp:Transcript_24610/g.56798  ORF Transcript_24610/g.56798 Transcript_24610/m.56798 type:complete len:487 (+) Transcript_24610:124-1584(+)
MANIARLLFSLALCCLPQPAASLKRATGALNVQQQATELLAKRAVLSSGQVQPLDAGWFDGFSHSESTFDDNGDGPTEAVGKYRQTQFVEGYSLHLDDVLSGGRFKPAAFFHESPSAASVAAWSTYHGNFQQPPWRISGGGRYVQEYVAGGGEGSGPKQADWFDNSVIQRDIWGRERQPNPPLYWEQNSGRWYTLWQERAVNTTLTCEQPNCTGASTLQVYDPATEIVANCRLSFPVHPTDYDDLYSGERVEFVNVNGHRAQTDCYPAQSCCDGPMPMFYCLQDYPIDALLNTTSGRVMIEAKIPEVVDECPYDGNMLAAVPMVTCMVQPLHNETTEVPAEPACIGGNLSWSIPIQCPTRGCTASGSFEQVRNYKIKECSLDVSIRQTDFDGDHGSVELVEWVNVSGVAVATDAAPGENPCGCEAHNGSESIIHNSFTLVSGHNVTEEARSGQIPVLVKISDLVDECASQGYLLDATATLSCEISC